LRSYASVKERRTASTDFSTGDQHRRHVRLLAAWCSDVRHSGDLGAVSHEDLATVLASTQANPRPDGARKKAGSINALRASLRGFFLHLHRQRCPATDRTGCSSCWRTPTDPTGDATPRCST